MAAVEEKVYAWAHDPPAHPLGPHQPRPGRFCVPGRPAPLAPAPWRVGGLRLRVPPDTNPSQVAAAEVQLKDAQDAVEEAIGAGRNSAATPIPPEELERRKRLLRKSEEELARCTAELDRCTAELAAVAQRTALDKLLDLVKSREERLERLQSQARAGTAGAWVKSLALRNSRPLSPAPLTTICGQKVLIREAARRVA